MIKIAVFSDMHIPSSARHFDSDALSSYMHNVSMIFGLGDYVTQNALDYLYGFGKQVYAVCGNMDAPFLRETLPDKVTVSVEQVTVGLIHGWGAPHGIRERIGKEFNGVTMICYGHTHESYSGHEEGVYYFNPGSFGEVRGSFGIVRIDGKNIDTEVIKL